MVFLKDIRSKIISFKKTKKITKVMEMISASKLKKLQKVLLSIKPYKNKISEIICHLLSGNLEYNHEYICDRNLNSVGYFVFLTSRGLVGSLNINLINKLICDIKKWRDKNINVELMLFGKKFNSSFEELNGVNIIPIEFKININNIMFSELIGPIRIMLSKYDENVLSRIYIVYNKFINVVSQIPNIKKILPLSKDNRKINRKNSSYFLDYLYEPEPKILLDILIRRYIETNIYYSMVESLVSEQAARMITMKSATENGDNLINELELIYNKFRQNSITKEIFEVVIGSSFI
ncbi:MAG: ATP synthase F1 complex subunit gamma [Candidatus Westeberhardia cardiocondylae]|nr:ATP synthase F1 complex subunit gamma [Candidatus Westeberhardia cardiocondylae]